MRHFIYDDSGWYKLEYENITIFWHVCLSGSIPLYSHGHNDIFSFVLYWKGVPFIIDAGRFNYSADAMGLYGKSASAHNTILIDGLEPFPVARYIYPSRYRHGNPSVSWEKQSDCFYFRISHDGFKRINKSCRAQREFCIGRDYLKITDIIQGSGNHNLKTFFHFGSSVEEIRVDVKRCEGIEINMNGKLIKMELNIDSHNPKINVLSGIKEPVLTGWFFKEYGNALPIKTCTIENRTDLPYRSEYKLIFPQSDICVE